MPECERARGDVLELLHADEAQPFGRAIARLRLEFLRSDRVEEDRGEPFAGLILDAEHNVFERRESRKDTHRLKRAHHTQMRHLIGGQTDDFPTEQFHATGVGLDRTRNEIEDRRLAGAVGTDERRDRALAQRDLQILGGRNTPETLRDT